MPLKSFEFFLRTANETINQMSLTASAGSGCRRKCAVVRHIRGPEEGRSLLKTMFAQVPACLANRRSEKGVHRLARKQNRTTAECWAPVSEQSPGSNIPADRHCAASRRLSEFTLIGPEAVGKRPGA
jgi:hypothetical protein